MGFSELFNQILVSEIFGVEEMQSGYYIVLISREIVFLVFNVN